MAHIPILSDPSPASAWPWARVTLDLTAFTATIAGVSGPAASAECATVDAAKERAIEGTYALGLDPLSPYEVHVLAITFTGAVIFVPESKLPPVFYAHLAWVNPVTGKMDVLAFYDGRPIDGDGAPVAGQVREMTDAERAAVPPMETPFSPHEQEQGRRRAIARERLTVLRAKGWAAMTAAERDEAQALQFDSIMVVPEKVAIKPDGRVGATKVA